MYCLKCGKEIDSQAIRCPYCDSPTENAPQTYTPATFESTDKSANSFGIVSIVLGSLGIFWALLLAILGWIFGGVGLALALVGRNKNQSSKQSKVGIILSAIALGLSFISSMIGILLVL